MVVVAMARSGDSEHHTMSENGVSPVSKRGLHSSKLSIMIEFRVARKLIIVLQRFGSDSRSPSCISDIGGVTGRPVPDFRVCDGPTYGRGGRTMDLSHLGNACQTSTRGPSC